jgi:tetratricopeptide (TPR) repeat protein
MTSLLVGLLLAVAGTNAGAGPAEDDLPLASKRFEPFEEALASWDIPGARAALEAVKLPEGKSQLYDFFAGRLAFEEGHYNEAVRLLEHAGVDDVEDSYLRLAKETAQVVAHHEKAESEHFIFFYPPGKDEVLVPYALETLERIRSALAEDLGHTPPEKVRVEVVNDARELAQVSTLSPEQINKTGTIAICKFNKLIITSPKAVLRGYDWRDTLAHEFTHLVVSQASRNQTPIWLQEGLAKYLESRWRGRAGMGMSPPTLALLGERVRKNTLITFAQMHPSIALLPSHEDAAVAFAEVFLAVDYLYRQHGPQGLRKILSVLAQSRDEHGRHGAAMSEKEPDRLAVEAATGMTFPAFEQAWRAYMKKQPFPKSTLPLSEETVTLKDSHSKDTPKSGKEITFLDFTEVRESNARRSAHLGELFRARNRMGAATEEFSKAYSEVGDRYPSISNKYALSLLAVHRLDEAEKVLLGSLRVHPGAPDTQTHLGRIYLARGDGPHAKDAFIDALAEDPFDPEIHLSLMRVGQLIHDPALEARALKASMILTGKNESDIRGFVGRLGSKDRDLSDKSVPVPAADADKPAARTPDAGVVNPKSFLR